MRDQVSHSYKKKTGKISIMLFNSKKIPVCGIENSYPLAQMPYSETGNPHHIITNCMLW
jgi:hypothetical protein